MSSDQSNYKIDPNSRLNSDKRSVFGPIRRPDKDFKDFLNIGKDEDETDGSGTDTKKKNQLLNEQRVGSGGGSSDQPSLNLFDLSAKSSSAMKTDKKESAIVSTPVAQPTPSDQPSGATAMAEDQPKFDATSQQQMQSSYHSNLFDLASATNTGNFQKRVAIDDSGTVVNSADPRAAVMLKTKKSENTLFVEEKPDLASIASQQKPIYVPPIEQSETSNETAPSTGPDYKTIQQIIDQIVDKIYVLKEDGRSDTTIVLKNPPLFDGVKVTLTSYESAKGQYNITFENLTQMAKNVLDFQSNKDVLKQALDSKGVVIQMFTTTTLTNVAPVSDQWSGSREQDNGRQGSGQGSQQEKGGQREEES